MITITDREFTQLADYIRQNYGIHLKKEKKGLVTGRLNNVLFQNNIKSFSDYYDYILSDSTGDAITTLIDKITTNHTFFMREAEHFHYFRDKVLPYMKETVKSNDLRIWCSGCSTGEEAYTLAILLDEFFGAEKAGWDTKVLATDISGRALEKARKGIYGGEQVAVLPSSWRIKYFNKLDADHYMVTDKIKNEVIYRKLNLVSGSFPFRKKFHVIFCRNVMIYFNSHTKKELVNKFYDMTEPGGYLFIGHSESLNREESKYRYVIPAVYRKV